MVFVPSKTDVLRMSLKWSGWKLPSHYSSTNPQEKVVVLANSHSSVVASRAEAFRTLFLSLAVWCSPGQEAAVCLLTCAVI